MESKRSLRWEWVVQSLDIRIAKVCVEFEGLSLRLSELSSLDRTGR
jgi:hypothetical protein